MAWNAGYVADVPYIANYSHAMSPTWLCTAALAANQIPPPLEDGFRYLDLGCGYATTLLPLAAANPQGEFVGVDFMPEHVAFANRVVQRTNLTNTRMLENSFEDIVANPALLGDPYDYIVMHGVYTWVSSETRQAILDLLQRHLKPGGLVYAGYNAHPGWTRHQPLQHMIYRVAEQHRGSSVEKMVAAVKFLARMKAINAPIFANLELPPTLEEAIKDADRILPMAASYLAHEYLNEHWNPIFFSDLCQDMSAAKLSYVGGTRMMDHVDNTGWSDEQQELISHYGNPVMAETIRDMLMPSGFRRDMFARGRALMPEDVRQQRLLNTQFALAKPLADIKPEFEFRANAVRINKDMVDALASCLAERPKYVGEIMREIPDYVKQTDAAGVAAMLMDIGIALPVTPASARMQNAAHFNLEYIAETQATMPTEHIGLASPLLGAGKALSMEKIVAYQWIAKGKPPIANLPEEIIAAAELWEPVFAGLQML